MRRHLSVKDAHRVLTAMLDDGTVEVTVRCVEDVGRLVGELAAVGIVAVGA